MTLIELLTGKKPFKKKFQKYKNTEDKVKIVSAGQVDDAIEEKNIEEKTKLGKAKEIDDDGRDSNDEETDEEEEAEAAKKQGAAGGRRSSVRVIGGFDKTVESIVTSDAALEFFDAALAANPNLQKFIAEGVDAGFLRLARIASIVTFDSEAEIMLAGEVRVQGRSCGPAPQRHTLLLSWLLPAALHVIVFVRSAPSAAVRDVLLYRA